MDTKAAILALMSVWGIGTCATLPASAQDDTTEDATDEAGVASMASHTLEKV